MFRRGFKSWAEETSMGARRRLRLQPHSPLDLPAFAAILEVSLATPGDLLELPPEVCKRLLDEHSENWSAVTVCSDGKYLVVYNPSHSVARRNSDLAHEISHIILGHEPSLMFMTPTRGVALRTHNPDQEEEANWLCGALLLPREALLWVRRRRMSDEEILAMYGISSQMLRFRLNATGVDVQLRRLNQYRR